MSTTLQPEVMAPTALGTKLRTLRKRQGISQAALASELSISPSYLNLIESGKRVLSGPLLVKVAVRFGVGINEFSGGTEAGLVNHLEEVFNEPLLASSNLNREDALEAVAKVPDVARALLNLYQAFAEIKDRNAALIEQLGESTTREGELVRLPSEEISSFIDEHGNYFESIEVEAERVGRELTLEGQDIQAALSRYLGKTFGVTVRLVRDETSRHVMRRFDAKARELLISEVLPPRSRRFQIAYQIGLLAASDAIDALLHAERGLTQEARAMGRIVLANYFAAALLMPYAEFFAAARKERYDIELLGHRFSTSFEQVCHRLTTLRRVGQAGVPFHLIRIDMAGNISKRFSGSGIRIARFSGACPKWNVHAAFQTPGLIRIQISRMPDGRDYFCIARTLRGDRGGYAATHAIHAIGMGCEVSRARELVYSDGVDLSRLNAPIPVGVSCRTCDHSDCAQRAFPQLLHPLRVDENVRGVSFYSPGDSEPYR